MKSSYLLVLCILPSLIFGIKSTFGNYELKGLSFVHKGMYMFNKDDSPHVKTDGTSRIKFNYTVTPLKPNSEDLSEMDVVIMSEEAFEHMGYKDNDNKKVVCCDNEAVNKGLCKNKGHVLLPTTLKDDYQVQTISMKNKINSGVITYDVLKTGIYFIVAVSCDYKVGITRFEGEYEAVNPYGQLPAPQYGSLPFTAVLLVAYIIMLFWWLFLCIKYAHEIMSVHIIVLVVLSSFVLDMGVKLIYLTVYNKIGYSVFTLSVISIFVDCSTRTLTRILTLFVCMGLGVIKANLDDTLITVKFILFGLVYYVITFIDSYLTYYPTTDRYIELGRFILTSTIDAIVYFWIFISLMDTMDILEERKQQVKLAIYSKLRNLFIVSVVIATVTLAAFSYVVLMDLSAKIWKFQWFINDGIWGLFYFFLFSAIMIMWKPSENTSAYAYHMQVATEKQETDEGYGLPNESLVDIDGEGGDHMVMGAESSEMKPMELVELVQQS